MSFSPNSRGRAQQGDFGNSSASMLTGMEMSHSLSEKSKSRSPDNYKPLPAPPKWSPNSTSPTIAIPRRSSSIYSQASGWHQSEARPDVPSLTEHPVPRINSIFFRDSLASSATMSEPQLLLPRTYSPSSTAKNTETSASPPPRRSTSEERQAREQRPSALLPPIIPVPQLARKHLHTVSLSKAQAEQDAPGTEHFLPEEHVARIHKKAKSTHDLMNFPETDKPAKPGSVFKPHDQETIRLPSLAMFDAKTWQTFDPSRRPAPEDTSHWSGTTAYDSSRDPSRTKTAGSSEATSPIFDEPERGRTLQRGPRSSIRVRMPQTFRSMAAEYGELIGTPWEHYDEPLTPQPLFSPKEEETIPPDISLEEDDSSQYGTPPPHKFFAPDSDDAQSGVIPISPPPPHDEPEPTAKQKKQYRESAYYPYVGRRRRPKAHSSAKKTGSDVPELLSRAARKAVKVADKVAAIARAPTEREPYSPPTLKQSVTGMYLGWSEESKDDFDASKPMSPKLHYATGKLAPRPVVRPTYQHIQTPARPLDERAVGLADERPTHSRKNSIFGNLLEISREKGREKRREEIKKTIRLVPTASTRPEPEARSASEADVHTSSTTQATAPRLGLWGRRLSEFGVL